MRSKPQITTSWGCVRCKHSGNSIIAVLLTKQTCSQQAMRLRLGVDSIASNKSFILVISLFTLCLLLITFLHTKDALL